MDTIFQITQEIFDRSSTFEETDIGKWCWLNQGCIEGFCNTREEAETRYTEIFGFHESTFT
ncbi:MAG TPA: hypothetical protein VK203_22760 [Nostocaceae cyanobacterium]|nr:hypothetical protein [Nostocaceae cyanobacterium]